VGRQGGSSASYYQLKNGSSADAGPWYIANSDAIDVTDTTSDGFYYVTDEGTLDDLTGATFTIPAAFPNGYDAFYLMKYEMTQGMYRDFLNCLTLAEQTSRCAASIVQGDYQGLSSQASYYRESIKAISVPGGGARNTFACDLDDDDIVNEANDGEWIALNVISYSDGAAFADWAGLRPATELEFEAAARGKGVTTIANAHPWGTTDRTQAITTEDAVTNPGTNTEVGENTGNGLFNYAFASTTSDQKGPLRVGFAATSTTNQIQAGAGPYGNMDLAGNLWEKFVGIGNTCGRSFQGTHGDGVLTTTVSYEGNATNTDWPGLDATPARGITSAFGTGMRGGGYGADSQWAAVEARHYGTGGGTGTDSKASNVGSRLARTAP
jgi:hypothetical protein